MSGTDEFAGAIEAGASGTTWDQEAQSVIFGTYKARKSNVGQNNSNMYMIQEDGKDEVTGVWGGTVLDGRFEEIPVGSRVKIEYLGKEKSQKGIMFKNYKVVYIAPTAITNAQATMGGGEVVPEA